MLDTLFDEFDSIVLLDTETTGIDHKNEEIIELAALRLERQNGEITVTREFDDLIRLSEGRELPEEITRLTGITPVQLLEEGVSKEQAGEDFENILSGEHPLVAAYNAQFDMCFLYYFLHRLGRAGILKKIKMLDVLSVYKDRRPYPHKLCSAIEAYGVDAQNSHRAIDDTYAAWKVLCAMEDEEADLDRYINCFGYNPKYGVSGPRIASVRYVPQPYHMQGKLYEQP